MRSEQMEEELKRARSPPLHLLLVPSAAEEEGRAQFLVQGRERLEDQEATLEEGQPQGEVTCLKIPMDQPLAELQEGDQGQGEVDLWVEDRQRGQGQTAPSAVESRGSSRLNDEVEI